MVRLLVALGWREELQRAVVVLVPVPVHEMLAPVTCFIQRSEAFGLVVRPVFQRVEKRLCTGVVIAHARPAVGWSYPQLVKLLEHGSALHGTAIIRVQYQR